MFSTTVVLVYLLAGQAQTQVAMPFEGTLFQCQTYWQQFVLEAKSKGLLPTAAVVVRATCTADGGTNA